MRPIIVADAGINHNGSIEIAKKLIDLASLSDCQYIKFQKRTIGLVYSKEELLKPKESPWGTTNGDLKRRLEFDKSGYDQIDRYCKDKGIQWYASPWDIKSVSFLTMYDTPYMKVASASMTNMPLIEEIKTTNKPVIISTGMCSKEEIDRTLDILGSQVEYILSCTSTYPTVAKDMNMRKIQTLKDIYGKKHKIGFSNHSPGLTFIYIAHMLGAEMIEYHATVDRTMYGSDQEASIGVPGMFRIKEYLSDYEMFLGTGEIACLKSEIPVRDKLRK